MRISHTELEHCRGNPVRWVASKLDSGKGAFSYGYNQALKSAIYAFHNSGDPRDGTKYLFEKLQRFMDETRKSQCERSLLDYLKWARTAGVIVAQCRVRLNLVLEGSVALGGEISRVDVVPDTDTYQAIILGDRPRDWKDELRFPLIQYEIADQYHRPIKQVRVGFQDIDGANLETVHYGNSRIDSALLEAKQIGTTIEHELERYSHSR